MRSSHPEQYINRVSSTVIVLFKLVEGIMAGITLFHVFRLLAPILTELTKGTLNVNRALNLLFTEYGLPRTALSSSSELVAIGGIMLPFVLPTVLMIISIVVLVMVVIEAAALLTLRIARVGAGLVRFIHQIYMFGSILNLLMAGYLLFNYFRYTRNIVEHGNAAEVYAVGIIFGVVCLAGIILNLCYHKDIAMAMNTVRYEIGTGKRDDMKRTHLSGIAFLFSIPYALTAVILIVGILMTKGGGSYSVSPTEVYTLTLAQSLMIIAAPVIMMIKYLCVSFCYRNLKRAGHLV